MALNEEQIQKVRLVLASSGWNDVMRPAIENRGRQAVKALCLAPTERAAAFKGSDFDTEDHVLRAIIRDSEWMLVCWDNELKVFEYNRRLDELDRQETNPASASPNG